MKLSNQLPSSAGGVGVAGGAGCRVSVVPPVPAGGAGVEAGFCRAGACSPVPVIRTRAGPPFELAGDGDDLVADVVPLARLAAVRARRCSRTRVALAAAAAARSRSSSGPGWGSSQ